MILFWIGLVILVLLSGFFSGSETALFSLPALRLHLFQASSRPAEKLIAKLTGKPKELLVTILMMNVLINLGVQNVASVLFEGKDSVLWSVLFPFLLTLFIGEAIPKSLAISYNEAIARVIARPIYFFSWCLYPIRVVVQEIAVFLSRFFVIFFRKERDISRKELTYTLKASVSKGLIDPEEVEIFENLLGVGEVCIKEIMRPRQDIITFEVGGNLEGLITTFTNQECSRVVVISGSLDNVVGVFSWKDYFLHQPKIRSGQDVARFSHKCLFVPETLRAFRLLSYLQQKNEEFCLVVDEYGMVSGLLTKEDLIEEVIGQIRDKRDEVPLYYFQSDDVIIADGKMEINDLEEEFKVELENPTHMATVGGWLTEKLGSIPKSGYKLERAGLVLHVLSADEKHVRKVYIRKVR